MGSKPSKYIVTEKQLIDAIDNYKKQLYESKTISPTKFDAMQLALYGCKCLIWDAFGSPRKGEIGWDR